MANYGLIIVLAQVLLGREIFSCSCGCGLPADYGQFPDYDSLGVGTYAAPLEIYKPSYPPPLSVCKELGIPAYSPPPACGGGIWKPRPSPCVAKKIRHPFCISKLDLLRQKLALSKLHLGGGGCGCGCGGLY